MALGCVKVDPEADPCDPRVGEWGMLCVDKSVQRKGLGGILRAAAERYLSEQGKTILQLAMLTPTDPDEKTQNVYKEQLR